MQDENASAQLSPSEDVLFAYDPLECHLPACQHEEIRISGYAVAKAGLTMLVEIQSPPGVPSLMYPLNSFEMVTEFRRMLTFSFDGGECWSGRHFFAFRSSDSRDRIYWRGNPHGITICVTLEQWDHIKVVFEQAFSQRDYARVWIRLAAAKGGK